MTIVKDILKKWLSEKGFDGLCNPEAECGCGLEDLIPCGEACDDCEPAKFKSCQDCKSEPNADCTIGNGPGSWHGSDGCFFCVKEDKSNG